MSHLDIRQLPTPFTSKSPWALRAGGVLPLLIAVAGCAQILGLDDDSHRATGSSATTAETSSGSGECTMNQGCPSDRYCDSVHRCALKKTPGSTCSSTSECAGGHCIGNSTDKICCSSDCQGNCESCLEVDTHQPDGTCASIFLGTDPKGGCAGITCGTERCDGAGACGRAIVGTACSTSTCTAASVDPVDTCDANGQCIVSRAVPCPGSFVCDPMTNACRTTCVAQTDCVAGTYCAAPLCVPTKDKGATCIDDFECTSGDCGPGGKCK